MFQPLPPQATVIQVYLYLLYFVGLRTACKRSSINTYNQSPAVQVDLVNFVRVGRIPVDHNAILQNGIYLNCRMVKMSNHQGKCEKNKNKKQQQQQQH